MERYQPDQYGRMMPDAHGQWVSLRAAELTALDAAQKSSADAQATIAALQAEVKDLKEWLAAYKQSIELAQSSLTQRTAELEAAKRDRDELQSVFDLGHTRTVEADKLWQEAHGKPEVWPDLGELVGWLMKRYDDLQAELERMRALIAALPKVEGEIEVSSGVYNFILLKHDSGTRFLCGQIETEQTAKAYAALLQHRQGMEG